MRDLRPPGGARRRAGLAVDLAYGTRRLQRELERAHRLGAARAVIVGEQELAEGEAVGRDMASGAQRRVPLGRLGRELAAGGAPVA